MDRNGPKKTGIDQNRHGIAAGNENHIHSALCGMGTSEGDGG